MNIEKTLSSLKKIQKVEAPPFLLHRIKNKFIPLERKLAPWQWKWAFAVLWLFVFAFDISTLLTQLSVKKNNDVSVFVESMQLTNSNNLYYEQN